MLTYDQLDAIADSVNPMLGGITLLLPVLPSVRAQTTIARWYALLAAALVIVYGLMMIDNRLKIWPAFGADYSTHTALATALVILWSGAGKAIFRVGMSLLVAYVLLELYQRYHTVRDVVTTAAVISAMLFAVIRATSNTAIAVEAETR